MRGNLFMCVYSRFRVCGLRQGSVGDCWLVASLSCVFHHRFGGGTEPHQFLVRPLLDRTHARRTPGPLSQRETVYKCSVELVDVLQPSALGSAHEDDDRLV